MSSCFIQFDKPFYFAGDTISGHVYLYLVEAVNAREIMVKFKGWEVARWIQERTLAEHQRQNVQSHKIWHKVNWIKLRILELEWTVLILKMNIMMNQLSTTISREGKILSRLRDILEVELSLDFHIYSIALEVHLYLQDNILSHLSSRLVRTIPHLSVYLIINQG